MTCHESSNDTLRQVEGREDGAEDGIRTRGLLLGKEMLYH